MPTKIVNRWINCDIFIWSKTTPHWKELLILEATWINLKNIMPRERCPFRRSGRVRKIPWRRDRLPTMVLLGSLVAQLVKNPPSVQDTWVQSLGWENPLEKGKATYSSILAWRIPWAVKSVGLQRVRQDWATCTFTFSLSHREASVRLLSFSIRGQTDWKPQAQETNQSDHTDHSLV